MQINGYYPFVYVLFEKFIINHINEKLFVSLQINAVCLQKHVNELKVHTNGYIYTVHESNSMTIIDQNCSKYSNN